MAQGSPEIRTKTAGWEELKDEQSPTTASRTTTTDKAFESIEMTERGSHGRTSSPAISDKGHVETIATTDDAGNGNGGLDARHVPPPGGYKVYKRRWFGLVQLTLLNIIVSWDWLTFSPVSGDAATFFKTDETAVNWLSTAFLFAFVAITPVVIYVLHWGPKYSIAAAASLVLIGNWIRYAGSHSSDGGLYGVVMFGQILCGLAQPFVLAAPTRYSDLWFTNRGRVAATALMSLANPFGAALGQLIVPFWVSQPSDVSAMVLYVSIISSVCSIPSFFIPAAPPTPPAPSCETPKTDLKSSIKILFGQPEFWMVFVPFSVYVGFFNSISSLLNQILEPYGMSETDAGIAGAVLIVVGLVTAAITSPILDRTKKFLFAVKAAVPIIALAYLAFIWMPPTGGVAGPYVVLAIEGAASFALVPVAVEYLVELTHPISPEVTSTLGWAGGQLLGGLFIIISNALKAGPEGDSLGPPNNMQRALIFTAVVALVIMPIPLCLGLFGRNDKVDLRRIKSDNQSSGSDSADGATV